MPDPSADLDFYSAVKDDLCHPSAEYRPEGPGTYVCTACQSPFRVYEYVARPRPDDALQSCRLAEAYARHAGDYDVPCSVPIVDVPGIVPTTVVVTLRVLKDTFRLMRYVNDAFRARPSGPKPESELLDSFLQRYMETVNKSCANQASREPQEQKVLGYVLRNVERLMDQKLDFFEYYEKLLVPYVKEAAEHALVLEPSFAAPDMPLAQQWLLELHSSLILRAHYGVHCLPFDVIHLMIFCYAVSVDAEVVGNAAFDLMARVARGRYFGRDCAFGRAVSKVLRDNVSYKQNTQLYYALRVLKTGSAIDVRDSLSDKRFLERLVSLEHLVSEKLPNVLKMDRRVLELAVAKMFPTVLFRDHVDYYAFTMAVNHIATGINRKTGDIPKGVVGTAKQVFDVVKSFLESIVAFDASSNTKYWTLEVFKTFLVSDANLSKQMKLLTELVLQQRRAAEEDDEEDGTATTATETTMET